MSNRMDAPQTCSQSASDGPGRQTQKFDGGDIFQTSGRENRKWGCSLHTPIHCFRLRNVKDSRRPRTAERFFLACHFVFLAAFDERYNLDAMLALANVPA